MERWTAPRWKPQKVDRSITAVYAIAGIEYRRSDECKDNARANEDEKSDTFGGRFALFSFLLRRRLETVRTIGTHLLRRLPVVALLSLMFVSVSFSSLTIATLLLPILR